MTVFDQQGNPLDSYDLALGHLVPYTYTIYHEAVEGIEEQGHWEDVKVYYDDFGNEKGRDVAWVVDVPGVETQDAWEEEATAYTYVPYTEEELERLRRPSVEEMLAALMGGMTND